jgi:hypothetical protein
VIGDFAELADRMDLGLEEVDWSTRREIIRAFVN